MLNNQKLSRLVKQAINEIAAEKKKTFVEFVISEFSRSVTKSELAQALVAWGDQYMAGNNEGDFNGVAEYIDQQTYQQVVDDLPELFKAELIPYLKFLDNGEEEEGR